MASPLGAYEGGGGAGGKIRRRPSPRSFAASPYARPPAAARAAAGGERTGWLSRLVDPASRLLARSATRLFSSVFGKPPPPALLPAAPSPPPPALEEDLSGGEEYCQDAIQNPHCENPDISVKDGDDISADNGVMELEELLKQRTFTRAEFEHLAELLHSRAVESDDSKPVVNDDVKETCASEKGKESVGSKLPIDFSIRRGNVADEAVSPAELAKTYMSSRSSNRSPLRLRLHNPSSVPVQSIEASARQTAKPSNFSLVPSASVHASALSDRLKSSYQTPRRPAINRMSSSSPYFKSAVSSMDMSGIASSSRTPSSVNTFGRQLLKQKNAILNNENISVGPACRMSQSGNMMSPLLDTRPGRCGFVTSDVNKLNNVKGYVGPIRRTRQKYNMMSLLDRRPGRCGYLTSDVNKLDNNAGQFSTIQQGQCQDIVDNGIQDMQANRGADNKLCNSSAHAPPQSNEMVPKILTQLGTIFPSQKDDALELKPGHGNVMDIQNHLSQEKESLIQRSPSGPSVSGASQLNTINGAAKFTPTVRGDQAVDAIPESSPVVTIEKSNFQKTAPKNSLDLANHNKGLKVFCHQADNNIEKSEQMRSEHTARNSGVTNKERSPKFSPRGLVPSSLTSSNKVDKNNMLASSNSFTFPVPDALSIHSQAPPTLTLASPPRLSVEKQQRCSLAASDAPIAAMASVPGTAKSVSESLPIVDKCGEIQIVDKCGEILKAEHSSNLSKAASAEVPSSSSPSILTFANFKAPATTSSNGSARASGSYGSTVIPSNGSVSSFFSSTTSSAHQSFQFGSGPSVSPQTVAAPSQKSGCVQVGAKPIGAASFGTQNCSTGGTSTFSSTGTGSSLAASNVFGSTGTGSSRAASNVFGSTGTGSSLAASNVFGITASQSFTAPSLASSGDGNSGASFSFLAQPSSAGSLASHDISKGTSTESAFGARLGELGNKSSHFPQSSASQSISTSLTASNLASSSSFTNSLFGSAPSGSAALNSSFLFSSSAIPGSSSLVTSSSSLPAMNSGFASNSGFPRPPIFGTSLVTTASPTFGMPSTAASSSPFTFGLTPSPVFSFTSATPPTLPDPSPGKPLFGAQNPSVGFTMGNDQMNVENNMNGGKNHSPFSAVPSFGLPSSSPATPIFSSLATESGSSAPQGVPGIFQFGQQNPVPPGGGFCLGAGGNNVKANRRIIKARRKK